MWRERSLCISDACVNRTSAAEQHARLHPERFPGEVAGAASGTKWRADAVAARSDEFADGMVIVGRLRVRSDGVGVSRAGDVQRAAAAGVGR